MDLILHMHIWLFKFTKLRPLCNKQMSIWNVLMYLEIDYGWKLHNRVHWSNRQKGNGQNSYSTDTLIRTRYAQDPKILPASQPPPSYRRIRWITLVHIEFYFQFHSRQGDNYRGSSVEGWRLLSDETGHADCLKIWS